MNSEVDRPVVGGRECRICHSKSTTDMIQSPCLCKGSMGCVHRLCLEKWLHISSNHSCELCSFKFRVVQGRRYNLSQSFRVWLLRDRIVIMKALLIFLLLILNSAAACWLWIIWLSHVPNTLFKNKTGVGQDDDDLTNGLEVEPISVTKWIIIFCILTIVAVLSVLSLYFDAYRNILRRLYRAWYRVRREPVDVRLVLVPDHSNGKKEEDAPLNISEIGERSGNNQEIEPAHSRGERILQA